MKTEMSPKVNIDSQPTDTCDHKLIVTKSNNFKTENTYFYPNKDFPHLKVLNANYKSIREELCNIINQENTSDISFFEPWVEHDLYNESNPDGWKIAPLMIGGKIIEKNCSLASFLYSIIKDITGLVSASFSLLKPDTHIVPHQGYDEYSEKVLRYHLGLIIPKGDIGIRVGPEVKTWKEGESFIFDDFLIHEAWNFSAEDRYVLICDFVEVGTSITNFSDANYNKSTSNYIKS